MKDQKLFETNDKKPLNYKRKNSTFKKKSNELLSKDNFNLNKFKERMFQELKDSDIMYIYKI